MLGTKDKRVIKIEELSEQIASLQGTLKGTKEQAELHDEIFDLKREVSELNIKRNEIRDNNRREHETLVEEADKQRREIEHKIGLERKRAEFEREEAEKNARLTVREENLDNERDRMRKEMEYIKERMEGELDSMRDMTNRVMDYIPKMSVDHRIREQRKQLEAPESEASAKEE